MSDNQPRMRPPFDSDEVIGSRSTGVSRPPIDPRQQMPVPPGVQRMSQPSQPSNPHPQARPEPSRAATRPMRQDEFDDEDEDEEISPLREWLGAMQPYAIILMGVLMVVYGIVATAVIGATDVAVFTDNIFIQVGVAGLAGLLITGFEGFAISKRTKYSRDIYWALMFIDILYTARWNNTFSLKLMEKSPFFPIALMAAVTYMGFHAHVENKIYAKVYTGITVAAVGAFLFISTYLENAEMLFIAVYAIDIIGAFWIARLGEEYAYGKRID